MYILQRQIPFCQSALLYSVQLQVSQRIRKGRFEITGNQIDNRRISFKGMIASCLALCGLHTEGLMTATCDTLLPSLETVLQLKMSFRHVPRPGEPLDHQQLLIDSVFLALRCGTCNLMSIGFCRNSCSKYNEKPLDSPLKGR